MVWSSVSRKTYIIFVPPKAHIQEHKLEEEWFLHKRVRSLLEETGDKGLWEHLKWKGLICIERQWLYTNRAQTAGSSWRMSTFLQVDQHGKSTIRKRNCIKKGRQSFRIYFKISMAVMTESYFNVQRLLQHKIPKEKLVIVIFKFSFAFS